MRLAVGYIRATTGNQGRIAEEFGVDNGRDVNTVEAATIVVGAIAAKNHIGKFGIPVKIIVSAATVTGRVLREANPSQSG